MAPDLEFTGERYVPGVAGEIAHEHWHRYAFARALVAGRRVLDVSCGEGYGSALLAGTAADVVGVDIAAEAVDHARAAYGTRTNLRFAQGSATALPLADASVDCAVSFETIEHLPCADQPLMIAEFERVLAPGGVLVLSAPNPVEYSQARDHRNPYHLHEPGRDELTALLTNAFPAQRWYRQRRYFGSALWSEAPGAASFEALQGDPDGVASAALPAAMYFVVVAARDDASLPERGVALSLFADRAEVELARIDVQAAEVMRLDALLRERDAALERQTAHVKHLEELVAYRERIVVERDAQLAGANAAREACAAERDAALRGRDAAAAERDAILQAKLAAQRERDDAAAELAKAMHAQTALRTETERLERALGAQERIIAYRQSARWWFALPWLRVKLWLRSLRPH
ncbi:MAG: class I SAM-dependent methyltransferase [Burkholderiales bacterium]